MDLTPVLHEYAVDHSKVDNDTSSGIYT